MYAGKKFLHASLIFLVAAMAMGCIGAVQYVFPDFLAKAFSFYKVRPLHVTLAISWIFFSAIGSVYYYVSCIVQSRRSFAAIENMDFRLFAGSVTLIIICYILGKFGGKEYWEFPPWLSACIAFSWVLFAIYYFNNVRTISGPWPVYLWMWSTGIIFFLVTLAEQYLWLIPYFRENIIRDITIQWKSMGAIVGSWNMLVYGTALFLMERISGNSLPARSSKAFFFYFLGLTNLMFNWGHHTYIIPAKPWIKEISYLVSMTEILILAKIIYEWKKTLGESKLFFHRTSVMLIYASEIWILLNLCLAILMSIPIVNKYTHGTHITVAHAMGATIGINTNILLASIYFIFEKENTARNPTRTPAFNIGFWVMQISLLLFWVSLIGAGIIKAITADYNTTASFYTAMDQMHPYFVLFLFSGLFLFAGTSLLVWNLYLIRKAKTP